MAGKKLTPQQERFAQEYVKDLNGTLAAIRAKYSEKTAGSIASQLLNQVNVKARISELKEDLRESNKVTADMVIAELAKVGFSNIKNYLEGGNEVADLSEIPDDHGAAVSGVKVTNKTYSSPNGGDSTEKTVSFKLYDKVSALEKLGRHLGIFEKDNEQGRPKEVVRILMPDNGRTRKPKERRG